MRRHTAVVVVLVLAIAACGAPSDEGGAAAPAPSASSSSAAPPPACHPAVAKGTADRLDGSVECTAAHAAETIHSGQFTDVVATAVKSPAPGSPALRTAFAECDREAATALGADWRTARLRLDVVLPTPAAWSAGQRWFRCDVVELTGVGPDATVAERDESLEGALAPGSPLLLGCALVKLDRRNTIDTVAESPCDKEHQGEFAGVWQAPEKTAYPKKDRDYVPFYEGCLKTIAAFVKVPFDATFAQRTGYVPVMADEPTWALGDRGVRCFLWVRFRPLTASAKGAGDKGFPPNLGRAS